MLLPALALLGIAGPTVRYGWSDVTPLSPIPLGGYTSRGAALCELPGDRLYARAILMTAPNWGRIAVVSVDMLTIPESLYREVKQRLKPGTDLFLVATHTHCAPDSQMLNDRMTFAIPGIARFDPNWLKWYADRIASAVDVAEKEWTEPLEAQRIAFARLPLNRGRRERALPDTLAVRVRDKSGDLMLTHYAAHPVLYGPSELRPRTDFPGLIRGARGLFLPGAIGDMSPASRGDSPAAQVDHFATRFEAGPWREETWTVSPIRWTTWDIELDPVKANPEFSRLNRIPEAFAKTVVDRFAPKGGELTVLRIGKLAIVGVPGEPSAELGRRIRSIGKGMGYSAVLTVSHVNGWIGYILESEDYARGGYEASLGFHGAETGERVVKAARQALTHLKVYPRRIQAAERRAATGIRQ